MYKPYLAFANLAEAVILLPAASMTLKKLYQGSKSSFAYLLIAITYACVVNSLTYFILYLFPNETVKVPNGYANLTIMYLYNFLSLQSWIFGIKYF